MSTTSLHISLWLLRGILSDGVLVLRHQLSGFHAYPLLQRIQLPSTSIVGPVAQGRDHMGRHDVFPLRKLRRHVIGRPIAMPWIRHVMRSRAVRHFKRPFRRPLFLVIAW